MVTKISGCWGRSGIGAVCPPRSSLERSLLPGRKPDNLDTFFLLFYSVKEDLKKMFMILLSVCSHSPAQKVPLLCSTSEHEHKDECFKLN